MIVVERHPGKNDSQWLAFDDGTRVSIRPNANPQVFVALPGWTPPARTVAIPQAVRKTDAIAA